MGVKRLHEQLSDAWEAAQASARERGLRRTRAWLIEKAGLDVDPTSLSRKLNGRQFLSTEECEAIARVLGTWVEYGKRRAA